MGNVLRERVEEVMIELGFDPTCEKSCREFNELISSTLLEVMND